MAGTAGAPLRFLASLAGAAIALLDLAALACALAGSWPITPKLPRRPACPPQRSVPSNSFCSPRRGWLTLCRFVYAIAMWLCPSALPWRSSACWSSTLRYAPRPCPASSGPISWLAGQGATALTLGGWLGMAAGFFRRKVIPCHSPPPVELACP